MCFPSLPFFYGIVLFCNTKRKWGSVQGVVVEGLETYCSCGDICTHQTISIALEPLSFTAHACATVKPPTNLCSCLWAWAYQTGSSLRSSPLPPHGRRLFTRLSSAPFLFPLARSLPSSSQSFSFSLWFLFSSLPLISLSFLDSLSNLSVFIPSCPPSPPPPAFYSMSFISFGIIISLKPTQP